MSEKKKPKKWKCQACGFEFTGTKEEVMKALGATGKYFSCTCGQYLKSESINK